MKKSITYSPLILIFGFLVSCGQTNGSSKEIIPEDTSPAESEKTISLDSITDNRFAYIKEVHHLNAEIFIKVDYVDYLTGQEATDAEWRDEAYFIDGEDTITNITDGYYISNVNPKLRTFKLKDKFAVEHTIDDDGAQRMNEPKELNVQQIETYINNRTLLFLHVKNGIVERIDERFMP
ncbi:hypothetical protein [Pontibacter sp. G13]|uniref:hypothetical protein n=1 Tax=Pontibacter sp. G13 TaxID=3074898 RepID=UPI00288B709B|nr:hypothetical protein [Pontibacter sp. G13]WNJ17901.1 hypothetical protein RJD25_23860 [Pontibacter sp. G13]